MSASRTSDGLWMLSHRADPVAVSIADRHYNRQKPGSPQFVPPGRCIVLCNGVAVWVTSWPFAQYVKHQWAGAWVNSCFRNECPDLYLSSELITAAVAATRAIYGDPPPQGIVSFVDAGKVRRKRDPGRCYRRAGWRHVGFTKGGLWAFQQLPADMPEARAPIGHQGKLDESLADQQVEETYQELQRKVNQLCYEQK